jgi:hypothetical protein
MLIDRSQKSECRVQNAEVISPWQRRSRWERGSYGDVVEGGGWGLHRTAV